MTAQLRHSGNEVYGAEWAMCLNSDLRDDQCHGFFDTINDGIASHEDHLWSWPNHDYVGASNDDGGCVSGMKYCSREHWVAGSCNNSCTAHHVANNFTLWPGFKWFKGMYHTQDSCTFGCSEGSLFWEGANEEECLAQRECTERCSYCE